MRAIFRNVPVLDSGARGLTTTFVGRVLGDVLTAGENGAQLVIDDLGLGQVEIEAPGRPILAEPPVAVVETVGGWSKAQKLHLAEGSRFERIYLKRQAKTCH
ncbi:MAG: hypothetical protein ACM3X0_14835 [Bacteroidota bacterium]